MLKNTKENVDTVVLIGVLKNKRDLKILLAKKWYRIPMAHAPKKKFRYLAFYEPAHFGRRGKRIRYYARILNYQVIKRGDLLPDEPNHPRARASYFQFHVDNIRKLIRPIRNIMPRRISFGFATLGRLLKSKNILELYDVVPTEEIVRNGLGRAGIEAIAQYHISIGRKRYCLDFAVFCARGAIAVECDNKKAHSGSAQREKDRRKNIALGRSGWIVIRLLERDIVSDLRGCISRIKKAICKLGGPARAD